METTPSSFDLNLHVDDDQELPDTPLTPEQFAKQVHFHGSAQKYPSLLQRDPTVACDMQDMAHPQREEIKEWLRRFNETRDLQVDGEELTMFDERAEDLIEEARKRFVTVLDLLQPDKDAVVEQELRDTVIDFEQRNIF